jgi:hypothetical protein
MSEAETFDPPPDDDLPPLDDELHENGLATEVAPEQKRKRAYTRRRALDTNGKEREPTRRDPDAPPQTFEEMTVAAHPNRKHDERMYWHKQVEALWPQILEWLPTYKIGDEFATPDDVLIGVTRLSGGGQSGGAKMNPPIEGGQVCGDETESPDAALMRIVSDSYHATIADRRARGTYKLRFYFRRGGKGPIAESEPFVLDSPDNLAKVRASVGKNYREVETLEPLPDMPADMPEEWRKRFLDLQAQVSKSKPSQTVVQLPPPPPANIEAQLELARMQERLKASEAQNALELKIAQMEAKSREDALSARFAALEARLAAGPQKTSAQDMIDVLKTVGLLVAGPDGQLHPAVAGAPVVAPPAAAASAEDLAQRIVSHQDQADKARSTLRKALNFAEPSTEIVQVDEEKPEESFWDKIGKKLGDNLDVFGQMGLAAVAPIADAVLQPGVASTVKTAAVAAQEQLAKKAAGRPASNGQPGWQQPPKA